MVCVCVCAGGGLLGNGGRFVHEYERLQDGADTEGENN